MQTLSCKIDAEKQCTNNEAGQRISPDAWRSSEGPPPRAEHPRPQRATCSNAAEGRKEFRALRQVRLLRPAASRVGSAGDEAHSYVSLVACNRRNHVAAGA